MPLPYDLLKTIVSPSEVIGEARTPTTVVEDPQGIAEILGALIRHGSVGRIEDGKVTRVVRPIAMSARLGVMQWEVPDAIIQAPLRIEVVGYNSLFYFVCEQAFQVGTKMTSTLPSKVTRLRQRWERRVNVSDLRMRAELPDGTGISKALTNISYSGFSFDIDTMSDPEILAGTVLCPLIIEGPGLAELHMEAMVVGVSPLSDSETDAKSSARRVHLRISRLPNRDASWTDLVNDHLHPGTRIGSSFGDDVWQLYQDSGYLSLSGKSPEDFQRLQRSYMSAIKALDRAPHVGVQVVWPNQDGGSDAAVSMLKTYKHAWLGLHMARVSGESADGVSGRKVLRELLTRVMEHAARDSDLRWTVSYTQVKKVWSRGFYHDLAAQHVDGGDAAIVRFRALQFHLEKLSLPEDKTISVDLPSAQELADLVDRIREMRPEAYCEALDLDTERIAMRGVRKLWSRCRFERDRKILVARHLGKPIAAAIVETGAEGLHLFGLLDLIRMYPLREGGERGFPALLQAAAEWFQAKGKSQFVVFSEEVDVVMPKVISECAYDMGLADQVILSVRKLPELLEHLHQMTAPRAQQDEISAPAVHLLD